MSNKWKVQLVSPSGEVVGEESYGYASTTPEMSLAFREIEKFLKNCNWNTKEIVLLDISQMLSNEALFGWHNFRLSWGELNPLKDFAAYPNGEDTHWTLFYYSNGALQKLLQGSLPDDWWHLSSTERWAYLQK